MSITLGTPTNSGNQSNTGSYTVTHNNATNTKTMVAIVTAYDSAATDAECQVYWDEIPWSFARRYRSGSGTVQIYYLNNPPTGVNMSIRCHHFGTCTDSQMSLVSLISSTAAEINLDTYLESTNTGTSHAMLINPAKANSIALGGIIDIQSAVTALSVTSGYGTELSGSEADMGSQVVGCAYAAASGTTAEIRWTKSASASSYALVTTFYEVFAPTIALNYPGADATGIALAPAMLFTGSDAESGTIEYHIQIDTVNTFDSQSQSNAIVYGELYYDIGSEGFNAERRGKAMKSLWKTKLTSVTSNLWGESNLTGNAYAEVYSHCLKWNTNDCPLTLLATSDAVVAANMNNPIFNFSGANQIILQPYTNYIVLFHVASTVGNAWIYQGTWRYEGKGISGNPGVWQFNTDRQCQTTGIKYTPLINKYSSVPDTGFVDVTNGADSHPFAAGDQIRYTVQSNLAYSTDYFWKVVAIDSSGYVTASETRKFTTIGASWVTKNLKAYIGGSWQTKPLKAYIGGTWTTKPVKKIG